MKTTYSVTPTLSSRKNCQRHPLPLPPRPPSPVLCLGLDVHNDSIAVSLAPSDSTEVRRYGIIGGHKRSS